ncbi:hypothetical protein C8J56DRAFT_327660 [Mycena floridula]|nr:hypothetical protein C8J56DRAFT_327660 [Mycena floridula]
MAPPLSWIPGFAGPKNNEDLAPLLQPEDEVASTTTLPSPQNEAASTTSLLQNAADVAAALNSGKLPSQAQIDSFARGFLKADLLKFPAGQLSQQASNVILRARSVLELLLILGLEKNPDDKLQDLFFSIAQMDSTDLALDLDGITLQEPDALAEIKQEAPTPAEVKNDIAVLIVSTRSILSLLFTSVAFRAFLSSLVFLLRQGIASAAVTVGELAQQVEDAAGSVEQVATAVEKASEEIQEAAQTDIVADAAALDLDSMKAKAADVAHEVVEQLDTDVHAENPPVERILQPSTDFEEAGDRVDLVVTQFQQVLSEARNDPRCIESLHRVIFLLRKYANKVESASQSLVSSTEPDSTAEPFVKIDSSILSDDVLEVLGDSKTVLERFARGSSLDPAITTFQDIIFKPAVNTQETAPPDIPWTSYLSQIQTIISRSRSDAAYSGSVECRRDLVTAVERGKELYKSGIPLSFDPRVKELFTHFSNFIHALQIDATTNRFFTAAHALGSAVSDYISLVLPSKPNTSGISALGETFWKDLRVYIIPKVLNAVVKTLWRGPGVPIPLPRVEFVDPKVSVALDGRLAIGSTSTLPPSSSCCSCFSSTAEDTTPVKSDPSMTDWLLPSSIRISRWSEVKIDLLRNNSPVASSSSAISTSNTVQVHVDDVFAAPVSQKRRISLHGLLYHLDYKGLIGYKDEGVLDLDLDFDKDGPGAGLDVEFEINTGDNAQEKDPFTVRSVNLNLPDTVKFRPSIPSSKHWIFNNVLVLPVINLAVKSQVQRMLETYISDSLQSFAKVVSDVTSEGESSWWHKVQQVVSRLTHREEVPPESTTETTLSLGGIQFHKQSADQDESAVAVGFAPQLVSLPQPSLTRQVDIGVERVADSVQRGTETTREAAADIGDEVAAASERFHHRQVVEEHRQGWRSDAFGKLQV